MFENFNYNLSNWFARRAGVTRNQINQYNYQYLVDKPAWLSLSNAAEYRLAVAGNPVLYGCIDILANASSNGRKYLVDLKGKEIPWTSGIRGVQNARRLFVERPNPLQSKKEFDFERRFMFSIFGNNYVYLNNPLENFQTDITNVLTMICLPSEYVTVKQTGRIYDQINIEGIIEKYSLLGTSPAREFEPKNIIHFNDINITNIGNSIVGSSRLENLKWAITNTQLCFEAMNVILKSRGMQGIIKANNKDAQGSAIPLSPDAKKEIQDTFKNKYGLGENQDQYLISYTDIDYIKTIMNSQELGIYQEFSNNAMIISNGFGIPPELYKTYIAGATFENQVQAERRLYQNTVIPLVENDDQYFTERLRMRDYGFELRTKWDHISCLQDGYKEKAMAMNFNSKAADMAWNSNSITLNEYRKMIGLEPIVGCDLRKSEMTVIQIPNPTANENVIEPIN
jgi:phage portal protein BeeE